MARYNVYDPRRRILSGLRNVRARTWLILGGAAFGVVGLLFWATFALLSWLWAQAPQVAGTGWQLADQVIMRVEKAVPGVQGEIENLLQGSNANLPEKDVSGSDPGSVNRFPGLVRSQFLRDETVIEATYVGVADFDAALNHYLQNFAAKDFAGEVLAAGPEEERHQFVGGASEKFEVRVGRLPDGVVEVNVRQLLK